MRALKRTGVVVLSTALATLPVQQLDAQIDPDMGFDDEGVGLSVRGGAAIPTADLADFTDPGAAFGAELAWPVAERVNLTLDGNVDMLNASTAAAPDLNLWHYGAGLDLEATPEESPLSVVISGGANATTMDSGALDPTEESDFTETYFGVNAGLQVGYDISDNVEFAFDRAITVPITAALRIGLN